jgi:Flp pilus assembly protein TadD
MDALQAQYDEAMFEFSRGEYDAAAAKLRSVLEVEPQHFEAQLALGMTYYRRGDYASAIAEGKKAERMKPHDQLVHTNLSLFFMKAGDKTTAEHHGLQARISSWREESKAPDAKPADNPELQMAKPKLEPVKFPAMPWKKKPDGKH